MTIENLVTVGDVSVTRVEGGGGNNSSHEWLITFTMMGIPENLGNLPLLTVDDSMLTGAEIHVSKVSSGCCTLQVSLNGGQDWTPPYVSGRFRFQDTYVATSIVPNIGPTRIIIYGGPFIVDEPLICTFGLNLDYLVPSEWISPYQIACTTPPFPSAGMVVLSLTSDSVYLTGVNEAPLFSILYFTYFDDATLASMVPTRGKWDGPGTTMYLNVAAGAFPINSIVQCMINIVVPTGVSNNSQPLNFVVTTEAEVLFGDYDSFAPPVAYKCNVPGIPPEMSEKDRLSSLAQIQSSNSLMPYATISLTANGGLDTTSPLLHFSYFSSPVMPLSIFPPLGPFGGGTVVTIHGEGGFLPSDEGNLLGCVFGDNNGVVVNISPAEYLSPKAIRCTSPTFPMAPHVQLLEISAAGPIAYPEIQTVTVMWDQDLVAEEFGVSLTIEIEEGCRTFEIPIVLEDSQASSLALAFEGALNATGCAGGTLVTTITNHENNTRSMTWTVSFVELQGGLPELLGASILGPGASFFSVEVNRIQAGSVGGAQPEVQRIQMSWPPAQSDVQKLTISLVNPPSLEIQRVTLSATDPVFGTFSLTYGSLGPSPAISANTSGDVLAAALQGLGDEIGSVVASRNPIGAAGYEWTVTFLGTSGGDRPEVIAINNDLTSIGSIILESSTQHNGSPPLTGEWSISSSTSSTSPSASLFANATALEVKDALETVLGYNVIEVRAEIETYGQGSSFLVTFSPTEGDLPELSVNVSYLEGGALVLPTTTSITDGIGLAAGQFQIIANGESTGFLNHNATAIEVKNALLELSGISAPVHIRAIGEQGVHMEWTITFSHSDGNIPEIAVNSTGLLEVPPTDITVVTLENGDYSFFAGEVVLHYLGKNSDSFAVGATNMPSIAEMTPMIEMALDVPFNVSISSIEDGGRAGSSYLIEVFEPVQDLIRLGPAGVLSGTGVKLYPVDHLVTPNIPEAIAIPLSVTLNGGADVNERMNTGEDSPSGLSFQYFQWPFVFGLEPSFGPTEGGTKIGIIFQGVFPSQTSVELVRCRFKLLSNSSDSGALPVHDEVVSVVKAESLVVSVQPDGNITTTVTCRSPSMPPGTTRAAHVDTSLNGGVDFPSSTTMGNGAEYSQIFIYMNITDSMALASLYPSSGPSRGGLLVTIQFPPNFAAAKQEKDGQLWCAFGNTLVSAISADHPEDSTSSEEMNNNENSIWSPVAVSCVSPPLLDIITHSDHPTFPYTVPLEVSFNGGADFTKGMAAWTYDMDVVVSALLPETGPVGGGTLVHVEGGPFPATREISCRFRGAPPSRATRLSNDALMCVSPELQGVPEKQTVHLASMAYTPAVSCIKISGAHPSPERHVISTSSMGSSDEVQLVQILWSDINEIQSISLGQDLEAPRIISLQTAVAENRPTVIEISVMARHAFPILLLSLDALGGEEGAISDTWNITVTGHSGSFSLEWEGLTAELIPHNAESGLLQALLNAAWFNSTADSGQQGTLVSKYHSSISHDSTATIHSWKVTMPSYMGGSSGPIVGYETTGPEGAEIDSVLVTQLSEGSVQNIQKISVLADPSSGGAFTLSSPFGGGDITEFIPLDAKASVLRSHLEKFPNIGSISVSKSMENMSWSVTFLDIPGDVPLMTSNDDDIVSVTKVRSGTSISLSGGVDVSFQGHNHVSVQISDSAATVKLAIESFPGLNNVQVVRSPVSGESISGGVQFAITIEEFNQEIAIPMLASYWIINETELYGSNARGNIDIENEGTAIGGSFTVKLAMTTTTTGELETSPLKYNSTEDEIEWAIENELNLLNATCEKKAEEYDMKKGFLWTCIVPEDVNVPVNSINIDEFGLLGLEAVGNVHWKQSLAIGEIQSVSGIPCISGSFILSFNGAITSPLPYNATPEEVEAALRILSMTSDYITVSRVTEQVHQTQVTDEKLVDFLEWPWLEMPNQDVVYEAYEWFVIFHGQLGPQKLLEVNSEGIVPIMFPFPSGSSSTTAELKEGDENIIVKRVRMGVGEELGGTWHVTYDGKPSPPIAWNASALNVATLIRQVANVSVKDIVPQPTYNGMAKVKWVMERGWELMFWDWNDAKSPHSIEIDGTSLTGTNSQLTVVSDWGERVTKEVRSVNATNEVVSCSFDGYAMDHFYQNSTPEEVSSTLMNLDHSLLGNVEAISTSLTSWNITFTQNTGPDIPLINCGATAIVETLTNSDATPLDGEFIIVWGLQETELIALNADPADVQIALRSIPGLENIIVSAPQKVKFFSSWEVTFTGWEL